MWLAGEVSNRIEQASSAFDILHDLILKIKGMVHIVFNTIKHIFS